MLSSERKMVKYKKEEEDLETAIRNVVSLIRVSTREFDKAIARAVPSDLTEPAQHFIKANIEFLTAVRKFLDGRIQGLEKASKTLEEKAVKRKVKREAVDID